MSVYENGILEIFLCFCIFRYLYFYSNIHKIYMKNSYIFTKIYKYLNMQKHRKISKIAFSLSLINIYINIIYLYTKIINIYIEY